MSVKDVEIPMVVGVLGAHSTGKSTFLARLAHELRRREVQVSTTADLGEEAQRRGLPLLFNHTWASAMWLITRGISNELEAWHHADVILVDRAVPDALGCYRAAMHFRREGPHLPTLAFLENLVQRHSRYYSLLFRTVLDPEIPLGTNKPRDTNEEFRELTDRYIGLVLRQLNIPHTVLGADGHDAALSHAIEFVISRLAVH